MKKRCPICGEASSEVHKIAPYCWVCYHLQQSVLRDPDVGFMAEYADIKD